MRLHSSTMMPVSPSSSARTKPAPHPQRHPLSPMAPISAAASAADGILLLLLLLLLLAIQCSQANYPGHRGEYCHTDTFRANCSEDEVIVMESATYGRMRLGRCVEIGLGYVGCSSDVLFMADRRCSGKRICSIRVPDAEFESTRPCLKELKTYLDASYQYVPVHTLTSATCRESAEFPVTGQSGYIASIVTSDTPSCDGSRQPWSIRAATGQRISLTLYDFALDRDASSAPWVAATSTTQSSSVAAATATGRTSKGDPLVDLPSRTEETGDRKCRQYGLLEDSRQHRTLVICGGQTRVRPLYTSEGETVRVWITAGIGPRDLQRFVIKYSVVGCADPVDLPDTHWFVRSGTDVGTVGCRHSTAVWNLRCEAHSWIGEYLNCSSLPAVSAEAQERNAIIAPSHQSPLPPPPPPYPTPPPPPSGSHSLPPIQLIAIVAALFIVAVAVVMSFILLAVVKSRRRRKTRAIKRGPKEFDAESAADFDGKQPLKLNGGELMRDIETLSSTLTLSARKDQCHVSCHWDTHYTHVDSFAP